MANWQAVVNGETFELSDRNPFDVISVTGVGIAPTRRLTQRGPLQHGETDIGFRLDPRNVSLVLAIVGVDRAAADTARGTLAYIFGARQSEPVLLRCTRDDGSVRQLDCRAVGIVDTPITDEERIWNFQRVGVQLMASDPNWYDPQTNLPSVLRNSGAWFVPLEVPLEIGATTEIDTSEGIEYIGTFDEYPILYLYGAMQDPVIENETTGDVLDLTGATIADGDWYEIDLRYGYKTVVDNDGVNKIAELTATSDLATFRLASILETSDGVNIVHFTASGAGANTRFVVQYRNRFVSL